MEPCEIVLTLAWLSVIRTNKQSYISLIPADIYHLLRQCLLAQFPPRLDFVPFRVYYDNDNRMCLYISSYIRLRRDPLGGLRFSN